MKDESLHTTDVLVIGGGLAGERCAMEAAAAGLRVTILSLVPPRRSHSCAAQGGMQAALGNCVKGEGDNPDWHFLDTVRGSDWGADQEVARIFVEEAPRAVRELAHFGVPWTRVRPGDNTYFVKGASVVIREEEKNAGLLMHRDFGGTAKWRTCYAGAGTGHAVLYAVDSEVIRLGIDVWDRYEALALIHEHGRCHGAVARSLRTGALTAMLATATVIATGGYGRIYGKYTTNATINYGSGAAIALATGIVPLGNMEAVQFHPTGLWPSGILVTEGCRGDGGYLLNGKLERFLVKMEPEKQELASRDVVSRHMMEQIRNGLGADSGHGPHLWLDLRHLGAAHLNVKLREVVEICRDFAGIDPSKSLIPVRPTQHYSMGGVRVNKDGQAYGMAGLFAAGEAACWDMHGFNRLGGNSLAETVVAGRLVGRSVAAFAMREALDTGTALARRFLEDCNAGIAAWLARRGDGPRIYEIQSRMAEVMINKVGIFRDDQGLQQAVDELRDCLRDCRRAVLQSKVPGMNPELTDALRLEGMIRLAIVIASGALARTESRGAHFRRDFPLRDDRHWLTRTLARWPAEETEPRLSYEPVGLLDLPPGHRGYGKAERIELGMSIEQYNAQVQAAQDAEGRLASTESPGSRMKWGAWKAVTQTAGVHK
ncbi:MAG TPA: fumarate reductase flavoprotein subunit [Woeseiaceae bacterium]|nr:fumarate reductase flavoprotein subunit [Woeseiaceae bacterium]